MTPEREKDIRHWSQCATDIIEAGVAQELLVEIDYLREKNEKLALHFDHCSSSKIITLNLTLSLAIEALKEAAEYFGQDDCHGYAGEICFKALEQMGIKK